MLSRDEVWLAGLDPRRRTQPGKTRPLLVVQAQALLDASHPSTLVIPLPASRGLRQASDLLVDQLRAIDNRRLVPGPLTRLSPALMTKVGGAMREVLELVEG